MIIRTANQNARFLNTDIVNKLEIFLRCRTQRADPVLRNIFKIGVGLYTVLKPGYAEDGTLDLTASIYIDWSTVINAIIQFMLVALVLFCILRTINHLREEYAELAQKARKKRPSKEDRKAMKAAGIKRRDKAAVAAWYAAKAEAEAAALAAAEAEAAEQARLDRLANPTAEDLLKAILAEMQKN